MDFEFSKFLSIPKRLSIISINLSKKQTIEETLISRMLICLLCITKSKKKWANLSKNEKLAYFTNKRTLLVLQPSVSCYTLVEKTSVRIALRISWNRNKTFIVPYSCERSATRFLRKAQTCLNFHFHFQRFY